MNPAKLLLAVAATWCSASASAVTITSSSYVYADVAGSAGSGNAIHNGTDIPADLLLEVSRGNAYSRTDVDYFGSGDTVTLLSTFSQGRLGALGDYSRGLSYVYFTVAANTTYNISGAYSVVDATSPGFVYLFSTLRDVTTSAALAHSLQTSQNTANENFVLGDLGGDIFSGSSGALTGSLIAGHLYEWHYNAYTYANPDADGGATASGFMRLDIGGGAPVSGVPETGGNLILFGVSAMALAALRRRVARM